MRAAARLGVGIVFVLSLFVSCSLLLLNAQANPSLEKVNLGDDTISIRTGLGSHVVDMQLVENTDHCFVDCHAVLKIHPYQDITLPEQPNAEFAWEFVKEKPSMGGLLSHHFEMLETVEYTVEVPDYETKLVDAICENEKNETYDCKKEQTILVGSHEETRQKNEYKPFAFWGETLKAGQDYIIKLVGQEESTTWNQ